MRCESLTHDPARQFASPYAYGPWDPINGTDPTGMFWEWVVLLMAAVAAAAVGIDVGVRTGDATAGFKAAAATFASSVVTAGVFSVGLGVVGTLAKHGRYARQVGNRCVAKTGGTRTWYRG